LTALVRVVEWWFGASVDRSRMEWCEWGVVPVEEFGSRSQLRSSAMVGDGCV